MNSEEYMKTYDRLQAISEYDSDIYGSEDYEEMLYSAGLGDRMENLEANMQMQLSADGFWRTAVQILEDFGKMDLKKIQSEFIRKTLKKKLNLYSPEERRTLMIAMTDTSRRLAGVPLDELEFFQFSQKPMEELEDQLVEMIAQLSWTMLDSSSSVRLEDDAMDISQSSSGFSAGAASGAAYIHNDELHNYPEMIGIAAGAVGAVSDLAVQSEGEDTAELVSRILLMVSASMTITVLFSSSVGAGVLMVSMLAEDDTASALTQMSKCFVSCVKLFAVELKMAVGAGVSGLIAKAVSAFQGLWFEKDASHSSGQALSCSAEADAESSERDYETEADNHFEDVWERSCDDDLGDDNDDDA